mmetsp:Transcript_3381/g.4034  ORF Transcript_3381/g.4034 Transcript_3381/m.4034 type:complete len:202 (+) Transcript_3381:530-1135(+)
MLSPLLRQQQHHDLSRTERNHPLLTTTMSPPPRNTTITVITKKSISVTRCPVLTFVLKRSPINFTWRVLIATMSLACPNDVTIVVCAETSFATRALPIVPLSLSMDPNSKSLSAFAIFAFKMSTGEISFPCDVTSLPCNCSTRKSPTLTKRMEWRRPRTCLRHSVHSRPIWIHSCTIRVALKKRSRYHRMYLFPPLSNIWR